MSIKLSKAKNVDINIPHCGPAEYVWLFANAEYIVTSSFHGVAFSINLEKQFINIYNEKSPQRVQGLLEKVGLEERSIKSMGEIDIIMKSIDYSLITPKLDKHRNLSISYLINAVEN
jgi:polysaccharide pyruvyl transferase WcaK-like protein